MFTEKLKTKKLWMEKANWKLLTDYVETGIGKIDLNDNYTVENLCEPYTGCVGGIHIPLKTISRHSKLFWSCDLKKSSEELRQLRRKFKYCSNYINCGKLARAKENLKNNYPIVRLFG